MRAVLVTAAVATALLLSFAPMAAFACTPDIVPILTCDWTSIWTYIALFVPVLEVVINCYFMSIDLNSCPSGVTTDAWFAIGPLHL